jgi:hypothetical protein
VKLTIHGHLMMRLIIVIYFVFDLLYCTLFVFSLITSITVIKLLHPFQMRWLMWIFNWILNVTLAILVIQLEGYGTLFTKKIVQNVCIRAPKLVCICLFCLIICIWAACFISCQFHFFCFNGLQLIVFLFCACVYTYLVIDSQNFKWFRNVLIERILFLVIHINCSKLCL